VKASSEAALEHKRLAAPAVARKAMMLNQFAPWADAVTAAHASPPRQWQAHRRNWGDGFSAFARVSLQPETDRALLRLSSPGDHTRPRQSVGILYTSESITRF
jgi:hypothetical protein